jgi:hypothetical protein
MTRRQAILAGLGFPTALAALPAWAFDSKEFWKEKMPSEWTEGEIQQLLSKSPWAKEGSIHDTGQRGPLSSSRPPARRGGRGGSQAGSGASTSVPFQWKATVRWESALPVRAALNRGDPGETPTDYVLNVLGEVPAIDTTSSDADLKDHTKLEHSGDSIKLSRAGPAPKNSLSPDGTLFYFSRLLALRPEDKEVSFSTKLGPLEIKCKFALKDMFYRGNLEL